jgi:hypothetical protein
LGFLSPVCLKEYNEHYRILIHLIALILDESMSGWRPRKTSKLGGLPTYFTFEPRKRVPLGKMFWNGMCCRSEIFVYVVMNPEMQATKEFFQEDSHLPDGSTIIPSHRAKFGDKSKG